MSNQVTATYMLRDERSLIPGQTEAAQWSDVFQSFANAGSYWLATVCPDGRPHVMPVLVVGAGGIMHFCTSPSSQKGRNLRQNPNCTITTQSGGFDLVLNGTAEQITDEVLLQHIADAYILKYGWAVTVRDGAFQDTEGAPTAGPPPYEVFRIMPSTAFAFGTDEQTMNLSTRWQFS